MTDAPMTEDDANRLASTINRHWRSLGYEPDARPVQTICRTNYGKTPGWGVASNMVNGMPTRRLEPA